MTAAERKRNAAIVEAAKKLRGSIGYAYISESAVFAFINEYDAATATPKVPA